MAMYIVVFVIQAIIWFLSRNGKYSRLWLSISFILLFFVSSFRALNIGTDYSEYVPIYYHIAAGNDYGMEVGYVWLNRVMASVIPHYCGLAIGVNIMLMVPLYYFITRYVSQKYWQLCIMIFTANPYMFIQSSFNILRQACAVGVLLLATHFFIRKKWIVGILLIGVAASFHKIAIVGVVIPLFWLFKLKKNQWYAIILASLACSFVLSDKVISFLATMIGFAGYSGYEASVLNNPIYCIGIAIVALLFASRRDKYVETEEQLKFYDLYLLSLCILLLAVKNDMVYRTYLLFAFASLPAVPIIWRSSGNTIKCGYAVYYSAFYMGYILMLFIAKDSFYIPFRFFFE